MRKYFVLVIFLALLCIGAGRMWDSGATDLYGESNLKFVDQIESSASVPTKVASDSSTAANGTTCTISSFAVGTADKLIIGINAEDNASISDPSSVTWDGNGTTKSVTINYTNATVYSFSGIYYYDNPSGTGNIVVTMADTITGLICGAVSFNNAPSGQADDTDTATGDSVDNLTVTVTSPAANSLFFSVPNNQDGGQSPNFTANSGQTEEWDTVDGGGSVAGAGGWEIVGSGSEAHQWTHDNYTGRMVSAGAVY